ncbi:MAG: 4Fe-4S dicluster domain-containing protein [bacterium]|nr:4Fe-4S dicluster domain-containing protein [bacterium]
MRITTVRTIVQTVIFLMFLMFVFATTFSHLDAAPGLKWVVSKFLEVDPLVGIATAVSTHTLYKGLGWCLAILIPTILLGRIFCNWICPYGILHHLVGWLFNTRNAKQKIESNRYRPLFALKYYVLIAMLVACVFGYLQIGLMDPICLVYRSFTVAVVPEWDRTLLELETIAGEMGTTLEPLRSREDPGGFVGGWVVGFILLFLVGMNLVIPRFFCRVLCPLGALLGSLSRFAVWRIERDPHKCTDCDLCLQSCEGASDPHTQLRMSECFVCFNCIEDCPHDALSFSMFPPKAHEVTSPDLRRRHAVLAGLIGLLFFRWTKSSAASTENFSAKVIRPPGSCEEQEFLERCIKCDQCIRVCPTNVLQPARLEAGIEGLWTPVLNFRMGFCQLQCTACGHVCPTGAIQRLSVEEKMGLGDFEAGGPVKLGTAHYDFGRCLPWSKNIPCMVCEEVCPVSPKAIHAEYRQLMLREGKKLVASATATSITLRDYPAPGEAVGEPSTFRPQQYRGDQTTSYHVQVRERATGLTRAYRIKGNDADTVLVDGTLDPIPRAGDVAALHLEFKVPKIDTELCIGCGICEHECPVVGDRRAVYVTAEGETRSQDYSDRLRNRSVRLTKTASLVAVDGEVDLLAMAAGAESRRTSTG